MQHVEGWLHILRMDPAADPRSAEYSVSFAPNARSGLGRDRRCHGECGLRDVLRDVGIHAENIQEAVEGLRREGHHSIPNVLLTPDQIGTLGF